MCVDIYQVADLVFQFADLVLCNSPLCHSRMSQHTQFLTAVLQYCTPLYSVC